MDEEMKEYLQKMEARTAELIHDTETRILRAFRNWAVPHDANVKVLRANSEGFELRLSVLEDRMDTMEQGGTK